jgi:Domain of unknown function (DUF4382)
MSLKPRKDSSRTPWQVSIVLGCLLVATLVVASCTSGTVNTGSGMGTISVMVSDPATCQAPIGPYSHVYVTITDVQANISSTASATDGSWVDLTPSLSKTPKQVDLLGLATNQCFLASLGDPLQLQAGTYQQIRVILASNSSSLPATGNACSTASASNCVVLASDSSVHALLLSSEAQTGIKIPSSQISSGGLTIAAGQTKELDINFLTCESIVQEGNTKAGNLQYRLKPVLHAGEVSTISTSINGTVLDAATGKPVAGTVFVAVEYPDNTTAKVDRVQMYQPVNADGTFVFCPLTGGPFDVVVMGTNASGQFYQPSIVTGVAIGSTTGNIKLYLPTATANASLAGTVTSQNTANAGTVADVALSALETVGTTTYTIPLPPTATQSSATLSAETAAAVAPATCPAGSPSGTTDCVDYTLNVPAGAANIGAWASSGVSLTVTTNLASYAVDGIAGSTTTPDCSPSEITTAPPATLTTTTLNLTGLNLAFMSCQ